jgi:L-lactate dehydrogenase complex protein LldG
MGKNKILKMIRQNTWDHKSLPENLPKMIHESPSELLMKFMERLKQAGAEVVSLEGIDDANRFIEKYHNEAKDFRKKTLWQQYPPSCLKEKLNKLESVILEGQIGVAENGAIWLDDSNFPNRLVPFIAQELIIILNRINITGNMSEAYGIVNVAKTGFGLFISGPSKTADIEQSLVYGAHGAIRHKVILY